MLFALAHSPAARKLKRLPLSHLDMPARQDIEF